MSVPRWGPHLRPQPPPLCPLPLCPLLRKLPRSQINTLMRKIELRVHDMIVGVPTFPFGMRITVNRLRAVLVPDRDILRIGETTRRDVSPCFRLQRSSYKYPKAVCSI